MEQRYKIFSIVMSNQIFQWIIRFNDKVYYFDDETKNGVCVADRYRVVKIIKSFTDCYHFFTIGIENDQKTVNLYNVDFHKVCSLYDPDIVNAISQELEMMTEEKHQIF